jgi:RNA-directed DNA polymerase
VKTLTGRSTTSLSLPVLLSRLNPALRGWTNYFRHGVSKATFAYLARYTRDRVIRWLRRKHRHARWKWLRAHYLPQWWPADGDHVLFDPAAVPVTRYRYRAARIPTPSTPTSA